MTSPRRFVGLTGRTLSVFVALVMASAVASASAWAQREGKPHGRRPQGERARGGERAFGDKPHPERRGRDFGPPKPLWNRMAQLERERMESFVQEYFPSMYLELERLRDRHPQRFRRRMGRIAPEMRQVMEMMETHPERAALMIQGRRLDIQLRRLAEKYRRAEGEQERMKLRKEFRDLCAESFDCRHQRRATEIRELETRIAELKDRHGEAAGMREKLIDQIVKDRLDSPRPMPPEHDDER